MNNLDMKNNSNIETVVKFLKLKFPNAFDDETDDNLINFDIFIIYNNIFDHFFI